MATRMTYKKSNKEIEIENKVSIPILFATFIVPEIPDYYSLYPVDFDGTPVACCPLHDEDTPSFRYYEDTNSFYCFGCGKGGNVVKLYVNFYNRMKDAHITKRDAIDFLYKYFIEGKELANLPGTVHKESSKNSNVDVVRFNKYRIDIEELITFDNSISEQSKRKIWECLDNIDLLLTKNLLDVNDAMEYCKNQVNTLIQKEVAAK